jgi:hypothetical protein
MFKKTLLAIACQSTSSSATFVASPFESMDDTYLHLGSETLLSFHTSHTFNLHLDDTYVAGGGPPAPSVSVSYV